ncbi:hypothetical protein BEP19_09900 [Ammoniphilus oxalaticus]|uniref:Phage protein n=1 Tax=Ammoniphilus oxalaticus TaxID=66863 RepID=A0A419SFK0_9BACL|nr:hypothetical protein [Ammoniphilus oxalaticus]RKD22564.1 hypothetical protein BEP19_09900 [Ammoniphilus oxalaticus]
MNQAFRDQLQQWKKENMKPPVSKKKKRRKPQKRRSERLSTRDIEGLMGVNRPTYARGRGGAYRQR